MIDLSVSDAGGRRLTRTRLAATKTRVVGAVVFLAGIAVLAVFVPRFFTINNFFNIFVQSGPIGLMAIGITFVFITGGIDLSLPATMALAAVVGAQVMVSTGSVLLGCALMLVVGMASGTVNGFAVSRLKMIPFVVTLAMMVVNGGLAVWFTGATSIFGFPPVFMSVLNGRVGPVPVSMLILIGFTILGHFVLSRTILGRRIFAVGINVDAARVSGIRTNRILQLVYVASGATAGVAAILATARLGSAAPAMGAETLVLDIVSAAVIGGVSIYGGVGTIVGAVFGALFITVISNVMNLIGVSYFITLIVKGMTIVVATGIDTLRKRLTPEREGT